VSGYKIVVSRQPVLNKYIYGSLKAAWAKVMYSKRQDIDQEQPLVAPQEAHLRQEPLRTIVNCWQVWHASPS
jgi:hypothetical protein